MHLPSLGGRSAKEIRSSRSNFNFGEHFRCSMWEEGCWEPSQSPGGEMWGARSKCSVTGKCPVRAQGSRAGKGSREVTVEHPLGFWCKWARYWGETGGAGTCQAAGQELWDIKHCQRWEGHSWNCPNSWNCPSSAGYGCGWVRKEEGFAEGDQSKRKI